MKEKMNELYQTNITDGKWIAYDIPGNVGWLTYVVGLVVFIVRKAEYIKTLPVFLLVVLAAIPAAAMLVGIFELINERIHKLDRLLTKKRLLRGFGALMYGGLGGTILSLTGYRIVSSDEKSKYSHLFCSDGCWRCSVHDILRTAV